MAVNTRALVWRGTWASPAPGGCLLKEGVAAAIAPDGPTALTSIATFGPDIALIDVGLPGMNGYELARRIREMPAMKAVPLVAVTGYGREEDRRTALEAGFSLHLVKPVDPVRLENVLSTLGKSEK